MAPMLEARAIACGYADRCVLDQIDLEVSPGEIIVLLGPNGSGKSTLLKTLVHTLPPLRGEVRLAGDLTRDLGPRELARRVAFVPQEELPTFPFTVRQMVMMGRLAHSSTLGDTAADSAAVEEAMAQSDCLALADRPVTEISGGERQRVLIARALASEAPLLMLDEPTSHLDAAHVIHLAALMRRLASEGRAIIAAIHDLNIASALGTRAILLGSAGVVRDESVEAVLNSPALEEVYGVAFERLRDSQGTLRVFPV